MSILTAFMSVVLATQTAGQPEQDASTGSQASQISTNRSATQSITLSPHLRGHVIAPPLPGVGPQQTAQSISLSPHLRRYVVRSTLFDPAAPPAASGPAVTPATAMSADIGAMRARAIVNRSGQSLSIRNRTLSGCEAVNIGSVNAEDFRGRAETNVVLQDVIIINNGCQR